ncbi:MAG: sporulation protein [Bacteroidales bacterium]|uniref:HU domain-containing protein n=1 Tax=Porphyromonas sp. TaxID=1924944 RepID=UPI002A82D1AD|nr:sporulation protein [Porphyromonas sp.]MDD6928945.1 sporulation protein [Bacteroidales bacterium]MDY4245596.1 sporulation protein [Porphyromonas sp.]
MYRIGDILEQALLLHDCVVLPTIGAFIVEQTPPLYDKDLNVITPAGQRISFNASLVDRDGILDSCYARTLGLSVRRARLVVDSDVTVIRHQLYQSGSLTIGSNLGTLTLQKSGELLFTPVQERQGLRSIHSYGLYPQSCLLPAVAPVDHTATEPASETKSDRKYWTIRINRTAANWAAAGAICFLCLLPISSDSNPDRYSAGFVPYGWLDEASVVTPEQKQAKPSIALAPKAETQEEIVSTTPEHAASSSLVITHDEALQQGSHAVVVGVFKGPKRAEQFIEEAAADQTQAEGISLQIIQESSRCLVIAGISSSEERAGELRRSVSTLSNSFAGAWIYAL